MAAGSAGTLYVDVLPDTRLFGLALRSSMTTMASSQQGALKAAGSTITKGLTLGLVAGGAAAIKMALDFSSSFTKVQAITNASTAQVDKWKSAVLQLSGQTARSPAELGDALYYLASAGLKTNQVLPALTADAQAAAVGLGSTSDLARITASALNAYASTGLTATHVTDVLVAAVKEGTAAPDEFATAMGRVLPIASAAGVSFDQVAASLAVLSNIGLNVNEGVTAMRGVIQAILAPTATARKEMGDLGITAAQLRDVLTKHGLLAALDFLKQKSGGNIDVLKALVPNIRSLTGVLGNITQVGPKVAGEYDRIAHSAGDLKTALDITKQSQAFQFRKALNDIGLVLLDVGQHALPVVLDAIKLVAPALKWAADNASTLLSAFLLYKSVTFIPALFSGIASALGTLTTAFTGTGAAAGAAASGGIASFLSGIGDIAAAGAGEAFGPIALLPQLIQDNTAGSGVSDLSDNASAAQKLFTLYKGGKITMDQFSLAMAAANDRANGLTGAQAASTKWTQAQETAYQSFIKTIGQYTSASGNSLANTLAGNNEAYGKAANLISAYTGAQQDSSDAMKHTMKVYDEYQNGLLKTADATSNVTDATSASTFAIENFMQSFDTGPKTSIAQGMLDTFSSVTGTAIDTSKTTIQALADMKGAWQSYADNVGTTISGLFTHFDALAAKPKSTFADLRKGMSQDISSMKAFGADLQTIGTDAKAGIPGAQELLQHIIAMGPAGAHVADVIASASPKARQALERQLGGGLKAAQTIGQRVTTALVGGMNRMVAAILVATGQAHSFQDALNQIHDVHATITAEADTAAALSEFQNLVATIESANPTVHVNIDTSLHGGGGLLPHKAAGGPVSPGAAYMVGEKGPEMFVPSVAGRIIPNGGVGGGATGVMTLVQGTLSIDPKGHAFIRGVARSEIGAERAYRGR